MFLYLNLFVSLLYIINLCIHLTQGVLLAEIGLFSSFRGFGLLNEIYDNEKLKNECFSAKHHFR